MKALLVLIIVLVAGFGGLNYYQQQLKKKATSANVAAPVAPKKPVLTQTHLPETTGCKTSGPDRGFMWFSRAGVEELAKNKVIKITSPIGACYKLGSKKIIYSFFLEGQQTVLLSADTNEVSLENIDEGPVSAVNFADISRDFYGEDRKVEPQQSILSRWGLKPADNIAVLTLRLAKPFDYDTQMANKKVVVLSYAKVIAANDLVEISKTHPLLVDIRPAEQFARQHRAGAINIPYTAVQDTLDIRWPFASYSVRDKFSLTGLPPDKDKPIVVFSDGIKYQTQAVRALYAMSKDGRKNLYYYGD